ncbi:unnamed protein product [Mesocestoides corti]|uniref:Uncharacterized protein n=1 Tax=Mesocestoides corti TaxID=53468 RepID=A0A158QTM0_MESCO|nr:unnamed protein product [Mesocestoides corti]
MGIHMPRECWIVINNTSGVPALCTLKLDNFESQERICFDEIVENDWQVQNRKVQDFCRRLLSTKKCFAISIDSIRVIGSLSNAFDTKTSAIDVPPYKSVAIRLVGCADIFGEFQDTLTISLEPSRVCSLGAQPLIARLPIVARACGSPVDFLTASKSVNKPIFNECYKTKVTDSNSYGLLLSSIPARETTANLGITSCISPNVRREVKLRNNSAFTIRVDWHLYRYSLSNNENHLLDLCAILNGCYHSVEGEEQKKDKSDDTPHLSLLLRPHEGRAVSRSSSSDKRFIEPTADDDDGTIRLWSHQTIIPPHNVASVFVDLNRVSASSQLGAKIRAYALGYISVDGAGRHVSLPEPLLCPQLRLNLKASVQQPMLELEYGDELSKHVVLAPGIGVNAPEPMRFTIGADNFILSASEIRSTCNASNHECLTAKHSDDEQLHIVEYSRVPKANVCLADRVWFLRRLRLRNRSPYGLGVQLEVTEGDFFFRDDYPLKAGHRNRLVKFLDPSIVKIEMVSRKRLIVKSESIESVSTESEWFGRVSCELYNPEQAEIMKPAEDLMRVRVGVEGRLKLPEISVINTQALEFPDTFTSQSSMLDIKISNLGLSGTVWAVQFSNTLIGPHKSSKAGCQEAAFSINPRSGVLAAAGDPHLKDRAIITVEFKPLKSGLHVGELRIVDFLTRRSVALTLKGRGIDQHLPEITPW